MQNSSFFNGQTYNAQDWANYFQGFLGTGVIPVPATSLQVTAGNGLNVNIAPGNAYINGYFYSNTETLGVALPAANSTYPTLISIILELNIENSSIAITTLTAEPSQNPSAPTLTQTSGVYQLQLATVVIPAGGTSVSNVNDTRGTQGVCGWCESCVASTPNSSEIFSAINGYFLGNQTAINNTWISDFNTTYESGIYSYIANQSNAPAGSTSGICMCLVGDNANNSLEYANAENSWLWQIAYDTNGSIYWRGAVNGSGFTSWQTVASTNDSSFNNATLNNTTLNGTATLTGSVDVTGTMTVTGEQINNCASVLEEANGVIMLENSDGQNAISIEFQGNEFYFSNALTNNSLFAYTPTEADTNPFEVYATPNFSGGIEINGVSFLNSIDSISSTFNINANTTATFTTSFWWLNGGPTGLGLMMTNLSVDNSIVFSQKQRSILSFSQIPQILACPINTLSFGAQVGNGSDSQFSVTVEDNSLLFQFDAGCNLPEGMNFTTYALIVQPN